jgi:hypothetical protein
LYILFEVVGMALQQFSAPSLLNALPLCLAFAAVINWALPHAEKVSQRPDEEDGGPDIAGRGNHPTGRGDHAMNRLPPSVRQAAGAKNAETGVIHEIDLHGHSSSRNDRGVLPDPNVFALSDHSDLDSLRSGGT